ncbi:MAG: hypothetical protein AAGB51_12005 [Planctomycetota bacterium]
MIRAIEDLTPAADRVARRERVKARRWALACAMYGCVVLVGTAGARLTTADPSRTGEARLTVAEQRHRAAEREVAGLKELIRRTELSLQRARAVGRHPDWSLLLRVLDALAGYELMLTRVEVEPREGSGGFLVSLDGIAGSQSAVAGFVVELEQTGLFTSERLTGARRVVHLGVEGVSFGVEATISSGTVPPPPNAAAGGAQ